MAATFHIKNFDRLQHYKDRSPPWIKLYNGLLDDYAFAHLPDASKAHLLAIGLLASRYSNKIPLDADWIAKRINATCAVDLDTLIKSGFIIPDQPCSNSLAERYQNARPERERETEREVEKETEVEAPSLRSDATKPKKSRRQIPVEFPLSDDKDWALELWLQKGRTDLAQSLEEEAAKFRDHHSAKLTSFADWPAAWRTWARNAIKFNNGAHNGRVQSNHARAYGVAADLAREILSDGKGREARGVDALAIPLLPAGPNGRAT